MNVDNLDLKHLFVKRVLKLDLVGNILKIELDR